MRKTILLIIWIVLIVNSILFSIFYFYSKSFYLVNADKKTNFEISKNKKVIEQNITEKYTISDVQSKIIDTIKNISPSIVSIVITKDLEIYYYTDPFATNAYVEKKKKKIWGWSWIIVSHNGYILTNKHVVSDLDADYSVVTKDGDVYKVDKVWTDPILDLAVIHVVDENWKNVYNLKPAKLIDYKSRVNIGQFVLAIWNALAEYNDSVTLWILSAKWRELDENNGSLYVWLYQTDAAINPWNSGWPLINILWEVIWVNTAITANGQWIWFSIPVNREFVQATLNSIEKYSLIKRPLLGVRILYLNKTLAKKYKLPTYDWVLIQQVLPNSPAFKAWLQKWDIIKKVDDIEISKDYPIIYNLFTHNLWDKVKFTIIRDWKTFEKEIKLEEF
jgi:serine protease Do